MTATLDALGQLAWPLSLAFAWLAGEVLHHLRVPRISTYALVGFLFGRSQLGILGDAPPEGLAWLPDIAFGLILFEFGHHINLQWLRRNQWLTASGLLEALLTFGASYALVRVWGGSHLTALLLGSLAMSTSPAAVMRVVNEHRGSGQVTQRLLHLTAIDCLLALFAFKVILGFWTFDASGSIGQAVWNSAVVLAVSAAIGAAFGTALPTLLRAVRGGPDTTLAFAIAVVLVVGITHSLRLSPLLASLTFGIVARHRRLAPSWPQRNFGVLGDLLSVLLFVYVASTLSWMRAFEGLALGLALVALRAACKVLTIGVLARASATSWRKGLLTGLGMMPMSVFVILLLEQTRWLGVDLIDHLAPLAAATLVLEVLGPLATQAALRLSGEAHPTEPRDAP